MAIKRKTFREGMQVAANHSLLLPPDKCFGPASPSPPPTMPKAAPSKPRAPASVPTPAAGAGPSAAAVPAATQKLTPEEQMALFEKDLKEKDWGHQPC
jgi:hypothetical protein